MYLGKPRCISGTQTLDVQDATTLYLWAQTMTLGQSQCSSSSAPPRPHPFLGASYTQSFSLT